MTVPAARAGSPADHAQVQYACAAIIGLDQSNAPYDACVRSVDRSLSAAEQQGNEAAAGRHIGLGSTPACISDLQATLENKRDDNDGYNFAAR